MRAWITFAVPCHGRCAPKGLSRSYADLLGWSASWPGSTATRLQEGNARTGEAASNLHPTLLRQTRPDLRAVRAHESDLDATSSRQRGEGACVSLRVRAHRYNRPQSSPAAHRSTVPSTPERAMRRAKYPGLCQLQPDRTPPARRSTPSHRERARRFAVPLSVWGHSWDTTSGSRRPRAAPSGT